MKNQYGLIGYPLSHSFSKKYFADKFALEGISDSHYELFEIKNIEDVKGVFAIKNLKGFNVTIPYKNDIIPFLDQLDYSAQKVGAVNVVKIKSTGEKIGYNSDYYGFKRSLETWLTGLTTTKALVLGIGGAAKAVMVVLEDLGIEYLRISRDDTKGDLNYEGLHQNTKIMESHKLIVNTTPLGMSPNIDKSPDLPYDHVGPEHYLYDLIYNPAETKFLHEGKIRSSNTKNGLEMLELQAEKSWEIWIS